VLLQMKEDYDGQYFDDATFINTLAQYTYPEVKDYYTRYIEGTAIPPYKAYFDKLGWTVYPKKSEVPTYGTFTFKKDTATGRYFMNWLYKKNELGLEKGDTLLTINGQATADFVAVKGAVYNTIVQPQATDELTITVLRQGQTLTLRSRPKMEKSKYLKVRVNAQLTEAQKQYRKQFYQE